MCQIKFSTIIHGLFWPVHRINSSSTENDLEVEKSINNLLNYSSLASWGLFRIYITAAMHFYTKKLYALAEINKHVLSILNQVELDRHWY